MPLAAPTRAGSGPLGEVLRGHRQRAGLTQQEVAGLAALSVAGLRDIEQGRVVAPRAQTLRRLGVALGLSTAETDDLAHQCRAAGVPTSRVRIGVLGPLVVRVDGGAVDLGSEVQRVLLGSLAMSPNVPVGRDRLLQRASAAGQSTTAGGLAARMSRLRRRLRSRSPQLAEPSLLATTGGYRLAAAEDQLDLLEFRALVARARRYRAAADPARAYDLYGQAVALWRGEPLAGLAAFADDPAVVGLARQWRSAVAEYAAVGAELGRYEEPVPQLRRVVAADPLHELAHARLMVALAGTGRPAEALTVFDGLRRRLVRELGKPPGPELVDAHRRVLRQEVTRPEPTAVRAYRALPPDIVDFRGRDEELRRLHGYLRPARAGTAGAVVVSIEGMAGVGKTRLAVHLAHRLLADGRYAHQQLYADLRGCAGAPPADPAAVLASFLRLLGVPAGQIPGSLAERAACYRSLLCGRQALVLLDDAAGGRQLAPLLPASPTNLVLVTSRRMLGLAGAHRLALDVFAPREGLDLLATVAGADRVRADRAAAERVVDSCGRLPLAVGLVARRLQTRPTWTLADLDTRLSDPEHRLDELTAGGRSVRAAFDFSYRALPPEVQRHFRLIGRQPGPALGVGSVADLAGVAVTAARRTLHRLVREHLVAVCAGDQYRLHDLVRVYAQQAAPARRQGW
jgi:DNA-binding SARP family transcriptional activator